MKSLILMISSISCLFLYKISLKLAYSDFFSGAETVTSMENNFTLPIGAKYLIKKNTYVNIYGCALYIYNDQNIEILIEECMFHLCTHVQSGGAIYFYLINGAIVMNKVCASQCSTNGGQYYQFGYFRTHANKINEAHFLTMNLCWSGSGKIIYDSVHFTIGKIKFRDINATKNFIYQNGCITIASPNGINASFMSIVENLVQNVYVLSFTVPSGLCNFTHMNFIGNEHSGGTTSGLIYLSAAGFTFSDSIFQNNNPIIFHGNVLVLRSWIKHFGTLFTGGTFNTINIISTSVLSQTINQDHFSTFYCFKALDVEDITVCPTLPASPTQCQISAQSNTQGLTTIFSFFLLSINSF